MVGYATVYSLSFCVNDDIFFEKSKFLSFSFLEKKTGTNIDTTPNANIAHANFGFITMNDVPIMAIEKTPEIKLIT